MTDLSPRGLLNGFHESVRTVASYMRDNAEPMLRGVLQPSNREQLLRALFYRELCCMASLERLDNPQHIQAMATGVRALLESTVDTIFLHHDQTGASAQTMIDWTLSAKLKLCEQAIKFYLSKGRPVPSEHQIMVDFYDRQKGNVPALRSRHWNGKHPDRWTGRTLPDDCTVADELESPAITSEIDFSLRELYEVYIRRLNWHVHGSGVAGIQNVPADAILLSCALVYKWSADLAFLTTKFVLRDAKLTIVDDLERKWEQIRVTRLSAMKRGLRETMAAGSV